MIPLLLALAVNAINPAVTQDNIAITVCVSGWTKTIRPSARYAGALKREQMAEQGLAGDPSDYQEDHLIPLEIGGSPTDPANLWPQALQGAWNAHDKDRLENALHRAVCNGSMSLVAAQVAIATDWRGEYVRMFAEEPED